ncbi:ketosteroid isomerase-like protein [Mycetocola sp. CAN_C7]|uniref:nuclear transport factor 2 family protein n=1 Tax=Mycetocola sp. CAN_C7 TaxID=2787724 RepID=UPI0018CA9FB7
MNTAEVVNKFLEALGAQEADAIGALFAADIDWYVPGDDALPWTGTRSKRQEVADYFRTMWPAFRSGESVVDVEAILIDGEDAAVFSQFSHVAETTGRRFSTPSALHIKVHNGAIVRLHLYEDTAAVSQAFFG